MRALLVLVVITCAIVAANALEPGQCDEDNKCSESDPCCSTNGWCGSTPEYCSAGNCNPAASFSTKSCAARGKPVSMPRCKSYRENFTRAPRIVLYRNWDRTDSQGDWVNMSDDPKHYSIVRNRLRLGLYKPKEPYGKIGGNLGSGVTLRSTRLMMYGTVEASVKMASPSGVVTAFILFGDVEQDEMDIEWVGKTHDSVQSNYYIDGIRDYTKGIMHSMPVGDLDKKFHRYKFDWNKDRLRWYVDGKMVRELRRQDTCVNGACSFPNEPASIQLGIWDASGSEGLADWSGGPVQWGTLPDTVYAEVDYIDIRCNRAYNTIV